MPRSLYQTACVEVARNKAVIRGALLMLDDNPLTAEQHATLCEAIAAG